MLKQDPSFPHQLDSIKKYLSEELLGQIPLFYEQVVVKDLKVEDQNRPLLYRRDIEVAAYQTSAFASRAYHKSISRIL